MITLDTTKTELKAKWKAMYQKRKKLDATSIMYYGYFTGKMEYTAWLLVHAVEGNNGSVAT
jgi:hypothetical protein